MAFISVLLALMLEQFRPLPMRNPVYRVIARTVDATERSMNAGERTHGILAWWLLVGGASIVMLALMWGISRFGVLPLLAFNVAILFLTLGFRQFSHPFTEIQIALENGNTQAARNVLQAWMTEITPDFSADRLTPNEITRHAIERAMLLAHRHVFGVFFWFVLAGAAGAVMYRLADFMARRWKIKSPGHFGGFAATAFRWIDWAPVRLTAIGFAIVGDFEDAMYAWRHQSFTWPDSQAGIVLSAGAGALGVRLGGGRDMPLTATTPEVEADTRVDPPLGVEAQPGHLRSAVGLVWRAMLLWLILLLMLSIAAWIT
ncbi:MAG TPA: CobD/CbiB family protein [Burkholderiaceae bacterium]|nr:CobD/CbiB family protein [Burkholderiaceae bacterium]